MVYDLENRVLVENGLTNLPYEGIVEGYFQVNTLSQELQEKFDALNRVVLPLLGLPARAMFHSMLVPLFQKICK